MEISQKDREVIDAINLLFGAGDEWLRRLVLESKGLRKCSKCKEIKPIYRPRNFMFGVKYDLCSDCEIVRREEYRQKQEKIERAYKVMATAIRQGKLKKASEQNCSDCGGKAAHLHHEDYDKPLKVIPLCRSCHTFRHNKSSAIPSDDGR